MKKSTTGSPATVTFGVLPVEIPVVCICRLTASNSSLSGARLQMVFFICSQAMLLGGIALTYPWIEAQVKAGAAAGAAAG